MTHNVFAFSFDQDGFEAIVNLTEIDQQAILSKMTGEKQQQTINSILSMLQIRAQFNQHRRMEVWVTAIPDEIDESELKEMAASVPQQVADIARTGEQIGGTNNNKKRTIV